MRLAPKPRVGRIEDPHPALNLPRNIKRLTVAAATMGALAGGTLIATSSADLQTQIQASKSSAASLQAEINAQSAEIGKTADGVADAKQRLAMVQAQLDDHIADLTKVQTEVMTARDQLLALERKLQIASSDLAANLRAAYENGSPNLVDVILNARGFSNLLQQVNYIKDAQHQDARIVNVTKIAREKMLREATSLGKLELRDRALTNQILTQRNQVAAIQSALIQQEIDEESARSHTKAKLASVSSHVAELQHEYNVEVAKAEEQARQSAEQVNQQVGGIAIDTGGMVQAPPGAPAAVSRMIAAGNAIATLPYIWGGGHGSFVSPGYDCSGSVSYVLAAAGMLGSPETSGALESYGDPGPGQWVTIYANAGHVWMTIAGWRFDTVALAEDGTRWSRGGGEYGGFVVRHPPGL
jgi:peptidoglycan hydrolase CwlO-like protein